MRTVKYSSAYDLRTKLIRYALSLGYAMDDVMDEVETITREIKTEEECDNFIY
jgi:regulatory protein